MKNVSHHCVPSLMVTLLWVVVIDHTIFLMRGVFIWYIAIEVKYWLFRMVYRPPDYLYMKFLLIFFPFQSKTVSVVSYIYYTNLKLSFIQSLFILCICHFLIIFVVVSFFSHFNYFVDQNSQISRFLISHIFTVENCVK